MEGWMDGRSLKILLVIDYTHCLFACLFASDVDFELVFLIQQLVVHAKDLLIAGMIDYLLLNRVSLFTYLKRLID